MSEAGSFEAKQKLSELVKRSARGNQRGVGGDYGG